MIRVIFVSLHTSWTILVGVGLVRGHPLVWLCKNVLGRTGLFLARLLRMGPVSKPESIQKISHRDGESNNNSKKKKIAKRKKSKKKKD